MPQLNMLSAMRLCAVAVCVLAAGAQKHPAVEAASLPGLFRRDIQSSFANVQNAIAANPQLATDTTPNMSSSAKSLLQSISKASQSASTVGDISTGDWISFIQQVAYKQIAIGDVMSSGANLNNLQTAFSTANPALVAQIDNAVNGLVSNGQALAAGSTPSAAPNSPSGSGSTQSGSTQSGSSQSGSTTAAPTGSSTQATSATMNPSSSQSTASETTTVTQGSSSETPSQDALNDGQKMGIILGVIGGAACVLLFIAGFVTYRKRRASRGAVVGASGKDKPAADDGAGSSAALVGSATENPIYVPRREAESLGSSSQLGDSTMSSFNVSSSSSLAEQSMVAPMPMSYGRTQARRNRGYSMFLGNGAAPSPSRPQTVESSFMSISEAPSLATNSIAPSESGHISFAPTAADQFANAARELVPPSQDDETPLAFTGLVESPLYRSLDPLPHSQMSMLQPEPVQPMACVPSDVRASYMTDDSQTSGLDAPSRWSRVMHGPSAAGSGNSFISLKTIAVDHSGDAIVEHPRGSTARNAPLVRFEPPMA